MAASPASVTVFQGADQSAGIATAVPIAPAVTVRDAFQNLVPGVSVTFAVASGGGSISGPTTALTSSGGVAIVGGWLLGPNVGANTMTATVNGDNVTGSPVTFTATGVSAFWTRLAPMPTHRMNLAVGVAGGRLYAVGGIPFADPRGGAGAPTGLVQAYDPATDSWATRSPMPTPRVSLGIGVIDGIIYAVGGSNEGPVAAVEAYDPTTDTWTPKAPLPTPRSDLSVAVVSGVLYAIGGARLVPCEPPPGLPYCNEVEVLGTVEAYNPATDTWTRKADMPTPRLMFGAATVNGIVYAVGGQRPGVNSWLSTVEAYDPATDTWIAKAPMPTARFAHGVGAIDGILYVVGGEVPNAGTAVNESYDPATDTWRSEVPMLGWRRAYGAGVLGGRFYAVGGSSYAAVNWRLDLLDVYQP